MKSGYLVGILLLCAGLIAGIMLISAFLGGSQTQAGVLQCEVYPGGGMVCVGKTDINARTVYCYKGSQEGAEERHLQRCPETINPTPFILIDGVGIIIGLAVVLEVRARRSRMEKKPPTPPQLTGGCYCRYCGKQISLDSVFCPRCGRQLT